MTLKINPIETHKDVVHCDGGGEPLGHPLVYLNLGKEGAIVCPYCSQTFVKISPRSPNKHKRILSLLGILCLFGCSQEKKTELPNPASQNCIEKGGTLQITKKRKDGGEYGICHFPDNRQCEEWALLRGACPVGGVKISEYTTPEAIYCAIRGGKVLENESHCKLPSGKVCSTREYFEGTCGD